jgi:hypothetical protein
VDRALFFNSTVMDIGDGQNTPFWKSCWLNGVSSKELAPIFIARRVSSTEPCTKRCNASIGSEISEALTQKISTNLFCFLMCFRESICLATRTPFVRIGLRQESTVLLLLMKHSSWVLALVTELLLFGRAQVPFLCLACNPR